MAFWSGLGSGGTAAVAAVVVVVGGAIGWQVFQPNDPQVTPEPVAATPEPTPLAVAPEPEIAQSLTPSFDVVRVDAEGSALVAGQVEPNALVSILLDGVEVSQSTADPGGSFVAVFDVSPSDQPRMVSLMMQLRGKDPIASDSTVILAPAPVVVATSEEPDADVEAPLESTPGEAVIAELGTPVDIAETDGIPVDEAEIEIAALEEPAPELPAVAGEPADKPEIIAAIEPEPEADLPVDDADAPVIQDDPAVSTSSPEETAVEVVAEETPDIVPASRAETDETETAQTDSDTEIAPEGGENLVVASINPVAPSESPSVSETDEPEKNIETTNTEETLTETVAVEPTPDISEEPDSEPLQTTKTQPEVPAAGVNVTMLEAKTETETETVQASIENTEIAASPLEEMR